MTWWTTSAKQIKAYYKMKQDKNTVWTEPKIKVTEPLRLCIECKNYALKAADKTCAECLISTSRAVNWVKK